METIGIGCFGPSGIVFRMSGLQQVGGSFRVVRDLGLADVWACRV